MERKRFAFWICGLQECQKDPLPKKHHPHPSAKLPKIL